MKTAIIYSTKYGFTEKISKLLFKKLEGNIKLFNLNNSNDINLNDYERIIFGASIYIGKIQKNLSEFIDSNKKLILKKDYFIFICSGDNANKIFNNNFNEEIIKKSKSNRFLGFSLDFDKLNFFEKIIIKIVKKTNKSIEKINEEDLNKFISEINK